MSMPADNRLYLYKDLYENEVKKNAAIKKEVEELQIALGQAEAVKNSCVETLKEVLDNIKELETFIQNMAHKL